MIIGLQDAGFLILDTRSLMLDSGSVSEIQGLTHFSLLTTTIHVSRFHDFQKEPSRRNGTVLLIVPFKINSLML